MVKTSTDTPETIDCTGKDCEYAIPVVDCFYVHNAEVPQIGIKCPECGKVTALTKTKSIAYIAAHPSIQQAIDNAAGFRTPEPDEHESLADRVLRFIEVYGYTQSKWTNAKKVIRQLIENSPGPPTVSILNEIMTSRKITQVDAYQIANLAIGGEGQSAMAVSGIFNPSGPMYPQQPFQPPGMYPQQMQPQMPYQQPIGQPQMPYQQQMQPQMPYQQPMPPPMPQQSKPADDEITIIEKLGEDGQVIERVIKQPKAAAPEASQPAEMSMVEQFKDMIEVMTGAGMIRTNEPAAEEAKPLTAEDLGAVLSQYLGSNGSDDSDDKYDSMAQQLESLKSEIRTGKEAAMQTQIDTLKSNIEKKSTDSRLSDSQYSEGVKKDIESMRVEAVSDVLDKLATPLMEMQANQSRLQTAMMISELEKQRGAPPGSYAGMFGGSVSDDEVAGDLDRWREKAGKAKA